MHIVAISGSLRKASCNTGVLRALKNVLPAGHTMDIIVPDLPLFNNDLETPDKLPASVTEYRNRLRAADCFLFGLSEYNFSISGPAKNAIDWGSRGADGGNLFNDKAAAVVSAGGGLGGIRATNHFRDISLFLNLHVMNGPPLNSRIFNAPSPFDAEGNLIGAEDLAMCPKVIEGLIAWTNRLAPKA
jgi:chromate reductase, NAD(P)H dehydrogenase (quinone)